jgi:hypothetical protein
MNTSIDIEKAIELVNKKSTTLEQVCKLIYKDIEDFQDKREDFYMHEIKDEYEGTFTEVSDELAEKITDDIFEKIQKDSRKFAIEYAKKSIDSVLDAMNQKKFKYKKGPNNLLTLLQSLQELNENPELLTK